MIDVDSVIRKAEALCAKMPVRDISKETTLAYLKAFKRMWKSGHLDPLQDRIARNTFYHRRAALHFGGRLFLTGLIGNCLSAREQGDHDAEQRWAKLLLEVVQRLEFMFLLEPPVSDNVLPWERPPSRWHRSANAERERGQNSKKCVLQYLPDDWDTQLWDAAVAKKEWKYLDELAVHRIVPVRPEELMAGQRPIGWSPGVVVELRSAKCLAITFAPVKSHAGLYGTELTEICVDPTLLGGPGEYLAKRCNASGGSIVVSSESKNAVRKAMAKLGGKALPEIGDIVITPYVLRNQLIADLKATFGAGEEVAAAAGHCTDRTQARYGHIQHGRKREGYLSIKAARRPRCGNVERARHLSASKGLRKKK